MAIGTVGQQVFLGSNLVQLISNGAEVFLNPSNVEMVTNPVLSGRVLELNNTAASYPGTGNTWYDQSGNGYNFNQSGSATWGGASVGWNLNGTNQYLWNTSSFPTQFTGPVSNSLTIFVDADIKRTTTTDGALFGMWNATPTKILYEINPGGTMEIAITNASGIQGGNTTGTITTGRRIMTMIASGSNLYSFNNNVQMSGSVAITGNWSANNPQTFIGAREFPAGTIYGPMSGSIKAVVAYNRLLSAAERQQVYDYLLSL